MAGSSLAVNINKRVLRVLRVPLVIRPFVNKFVNPVAQKEARRPAHSAAPRKLVVAGPCMINIDWVAGKLSNLRCPNCPKLVVSHEESGSLAHVVWLHSQCFALTGSEVFRVILREKLRELRVISLLIY
jgi:hypothetical protein